MALVARFLNGPHVGQDITVPSAQFILEAVVPSPLLLSVGEPAETSAPMPDIVQYRLVGTSGDVLYYRLNHHTSPGRWYTRHPSEQRLPRSPATLRGGC